MTRSWDEIRGGIFDSREIIERLDELESMDERDEDETAEAATLRAIVEDASNVSDWQYGETFIPDDVFEDYARELAEDIGAIDRDASWPNTFIDWPAAANELKQDYSAFTLDGVDYWARD